MNNSARFGNVRSRTRALSLAIYGICVLGFGIALAAVPAVAGGGAAASTSAPASRPPVVSPADKAAAEAQFDKASALYQQKKYAEAQIENDKALQLDPTNVNAVLMQSTLKRYLAGGMPGSAATQGVAAIGVGGKIPVLTTQQVSLIRLMELGPNDRAIGRIDVKGLEDYWQNFALKDALGDKSKAAHDAFINPGNFVGQVARIRESREIKYMQMITLTSDPATFIFYHNNVQTFVLANCATADCHGGEKAPGGNFRLLNPATTTEQQYTNFYILSQYANQDGKMVDRDNPEKSLLMQYGLPWASASTKHPKVEARKLTGLNDTRLRSMNDWIRTLAFPKPNYGITYDVPGGAAPAPASAPAATTAATATAPK
jgi:tetratricopeptide (TPR) repeat protein